MPRIRLASASSTAQAASGSLSGAHLAHDVTPPLNCAHRSQAEESDIVQASPVAHPAQYSGGIGEVNQQTNGSEFYGSTGTFYFLSKLRSRANAQRLSAAAPIAEPAASPEPSVINLLHSSDYSIRTANREADERSHGTLPSVLDATHDSGKGKAAKQLGIEHECVRLYFQNLHCIHPILDQTDFVSRCATHAWATVPGQNSASADENRISRRFLALFNAVLAVGAITAGESSILMWQSESMCTDLSQGDQTVLANRMLYPPIRYARYFFEMAKVYLDDVYESSSFETAQTLFLMVRR